MSIVGRLTRDSILDTYLVPHNRIHAIVNGTRGITADTDLRLCKFFGLSEGYFLRLQNMHETMEAKRTIADQIEHIRPYSSQTSDNNAKKSR
jgi:addiction module HigA family antidote